MDPKLQKKIRNSLPYLAQNTSNIKTLLVELMSKGVLEPGERQSILHQPCEEDQFIEMYGIVVKKGPNAFKHLIRSLKKSGNGHVADHLQKGETTIITTDESEDEEPSGGREHRPLTKLTNTNDFESTALNFSHLLAIKDILVDDTEVMRKWRILLPYFELTKADNFEIETKLNRNELIESIVLTTLEKWVSKHGRLATFDALVHMFEKYGYGRVAEDLMRKKPQIQQIIVKK